MKHTTFAAAFALSVPLILAAAPALAEEAPTTERFVEKVGLSDMFEVESGRVANERAQLAAVKAFGKRMVDDHSQTTNQLKTLVRDNNIRAELPTALDDKHQAKLDKLKNLSGREFDKSYIDGQVTVHQKAVNLFQAYSQSGENAKLKEWAQNTLPTLKDHLQQAQTLEKEVEKTPVAANENTRELAASKDRNVDIKDRDAAARNADPRAKINYVTRQAPTDWSAQALIGRNVKNRDGETLGDINNVILNEKGNVVAVTIGVGGFLGIGEKDVGVPFDNIDFRASEIAVDRDANDSREERAEARRERAEDVREARYDSEHEDIEIVLNASREQLENAPSFVWLDQQDLTEKRSERSVE